MLGLATVRCANLKVAPVRLNCATAVFWCTGAFGKISVPTCGGFFYMNQVDKIKQVIVRTFNNRGRKRQHKKEES
jgi:hypothetical protein